MSSLKQRFFLLGLMSSVLCQITYCKKFESKPFIEQLGPILEKADYKAFEKVLMPGSLKRLDVICETMSSMDTARVAALTKLPNTAISNCSRKSLLAFLMQSEKTGKIPRFSSDLIASEEKQGTSIRVSFKVNDLPNLQLIQEGQDIKLDLQNFTNRIEEPLYREVVANMFANVQKAEDKENWEKQRAEMRNSPAFQTQEAVNAVTEKYSKERAARFITLMYGKGVKELERRCRTQNPASYCDSEAAEKMFQNSIQPDVKKYDMKNVKSIEVSAGIIEVIFSGTGGSENLIFENPSSPGRGWYFEWNLPELQH